MSLICQLTSEDIKHQLIIINTPSIALRHLPPNSARFAYVTEGAFFVSAQLDTNAVSVPRKVWLLIKLQALVYDTLPPTTAAVDYAIGQLSANDFFLDDVDYAIGQLSANEQYLDVVDYAIGQLSANEQFLDDAQTAVSL